MIGDNKIKTVIFNSLIDLETDLIIGPFVSEYVKIVSAFAKEHQINFFSPLSNIDSCLKENPYYISAKPSDLTHFKFISQHIYKNYKDYNIILFGKDNKINDLYKKYLAEFIDTSVFLNTHFVIINSTNWKEATYLKYLLKEKNVLLVPIDDEIIINSIITNLISLEKEITIFGPSAWLNYRSVDMNYLQTLNTHFLIDGYIDYTNPGVKDFVRSYRDKYNTEPSKYSFKGYDYTLCAAKMLSDRGKYFQNEELCDSNYVHTDFHFKRSEGNKGWENTNIQLIKFDDYSLVEIKE